MSRTVTCVVCCARCYGADSALTFAGVLVLCAACSRSMGDVPLSPPELAIVWAAKRARRAARREFAPLERQLQDALRLAREHAARMSAGGGRR